MSEWTADREINQFVGGAEQSIRRASDGALVTVRGVKAEAVLDACAKLLEPEHVELEPAVGKSYRFVVSAASLIEGGGGGLASFVFTMKPETADPLPINVVAEAEDFASKKLGKQAIVVSWQPVTVPESALAEMVAESETQGEDTTGEPRGDGGVLPFQRN